MAARPRILIVGAGIAGLTLAAGLARRGLECTVVEINAASLSRGLALMLTSNVALALRRIGLDEAVIGRGIVLEEIVQSDASGALIARHDFRPANQRYAPNLGITRDALMSCLSGETAAPVRYATTFRAIDDLGEAVEVVFSDGSQGVFDLVVGADGLHSVVRMLIHPQIQPIYRSFCGWRTVMDHPQGDAAFSIRSSPGRLLGSFQVAPGLVYAFLLAHEAELPSVSRAANLERLKQLSAPFGGAVALLIQRLDDPDRVVFAPVREVETPTYSRGRIVLIGDAAHAFPPQLAQGAAMAIEDAVALAELLSEAADVETALRSYEARRRPRVESIRAAVHNRAALGGMQGSASDEPLRRRPTAFSRSLEVYAELIEDPFAAVGG
jgi:2-polyprenyl-6-methoxyphenol hydroxylase-like FAD-dependent oxidoreductase